MLLRGPHLEWKSKSVRNRCLEHIIIYTHIRVCVCVCAREKFVCMVIYISFEGDSCVIRDFHQVESNSSDGI